MAGTSKELPVVRFVRSFSSTSGCWNWQIFYRHWSQIKAGFVLMPGLQSQEGNRSPGLYSSKYGTCFAVYNTRVWQLFYVDMVDRHGLLSDSHSGKCPF